MEMSFQRRSGLRGVRRALTQAQLPGHGESGSCHRKGLNELASGGHAHIGVLFFNYYCPANY
jgi:hypothetical protein